MEDAAAGGLPILRVSFSACVWILELNQILSSSKSHILRLQNCLVYLTIQCGGGLTAVASVAGVLSLTVQGIEIVGKLKLFC